MSWKAADTGSPNHSTRYSLGPLAERSAAIGIELLFNSPRDGVIRGAMMVMAVMKQRSMLGIMGDTALLIAAPLWRYSCGLPSRVAAPGRCEDTRARDQICAHENWL